MQQKILTSSTKGELEDKLNEFGGQFANIDSMNISDIE